MAVLCSGEGGAQLDATLSAEAADAVSAPCLHVIVHNASHAHTDVGGGAGPEAVTDAAEGARLPVLASAAARVAGEAGGGRAKAGGKGCGAAEATRAAAIAAGVEASS